MDLLEKDKSKKSLQKGGEEAENKLRINISKKILNILEKCREEQEFRGEMKELNDKYHILENTYIFLGISRNQNKCDILRDILMLRRNPLGNVNYSNQQYPLFHCLSSDARNIHVAEMSFCTDHRSLLKQKTGITTNFYDYWNKFIMFLRRIIREIEQEILKNVRKTNEFLEKTRSELKNAADKNFDKYSKKERDEIAKGIKLMNNQEKAQAGPANRSSSLMKPVGRRRHHVVKPTVNSNNELNSLKRLMNHRLNENAGPANRSSSLMKPVGRRRHHVVKPTVNSNNELNSLKRLMNHRLNENAGPANRSSSLMQTLRRQPKENSGNLTLSARLQK